jgi:hypothetical protein
VINLSGCLKGAEIQGLREIREERDMGDGAFSGVFFATDLMDLHR